MTLKEREHPEIINGARKYRIAKGSGSDIKEVNKLMKQFGDTKKMMKMMSNPKNMKQMMQQMKGSGMPGV
jgi:signal recognition particle subunit SRP54